MSSPAVSVSLVDTSAAQPRTYSGYMTNITRASTATPTRTHLFRTTENPNDMPVIIRRVDNPRLPYLITEIPRLPLAIRRQGPLILRSEKPGDPRVSLPLLLTQDDYMEFAEGA